MKKQTRNSVLNTLMFGPSSLNMIATDMGKTNRTTRNRKFDNSVGRFVRRLTESGYAKRIERGYYKLTARGVRYAEKTLSK